MSDPPKAKGEPAALPAPPAALERFLREARALDAADLQAMRADARAVQHNVGLGVQAVLTWTDHLREHLPHVDLEELRSLPDLALCLTHAADEVNGGPEAPETREIFAEAATLRRTLKSAANALAQAGLFTPREVAKVGADYGSIDVGADCAALASLFEKRAADVEGRCPVDAETIARAAEVGAALKAVKPRAAAKKPGPSGMSAVEARDRLWTLLVARHERLWAVGAFVYGHAVDAHVPALAAPVPAKAKKA